MSLLTSWREVTPGPATVVAPDERLPWAQTGGPGSGLASRLVRTNHRTDRIDLRASRLIL